MRIVITGINECVAGGVETYLRRLIPLLRARGADVVYAHERQGGRGPPVVPADCSLRLGHDPAAEIERLKPDLVFQNSLSRASDELRLARSGLPLAFFAHAYSGLCISGSRRFSRPAPQVCERIFGMGCWTKYFNRGCGGGSPVTATRLYRENRIRLRAMQAAGAVIVASEHMRGLVAAHGVSPERLFTVPLFVPNAAPRRTPEERFQRKKLVFLGRVTKLKGWPELLGAFARFSQAHPGWTLAIVGEGPKLSDFQTATERLGLPVLVHSWQGEAERDALLDECTVLVLPSTWPEPFGIVGLEAARLGIPTATFGTGGIGEWLVPGENGEVAPSLTASALADTLARAVSSLDHYRALSLSAAKRAREFGNERHVSSLATIFSSLAGRTLGDAQRLGLE